MLGDGVNLAARLMQTAIPGETLCSHRTYVEARRHWNLEPLPPLKVKGKTQVVRPYRFNGQRVREELESQMPLFGRDDEINCLLSYLQSAEQGRGGVVSIIGEGGLGKTRLMSELNSLSRERGSHAATLHGSAESIGQQTPYLVWRDVLTEYFGIDHLRAQDQRAEKVRERVLAIDPDLEPRLSLLNDVLDLELPETPTTRAMESRQRSDSLAFFVVQLLLAYTQGNTLILTLDDMQWADSRSWDLVLDVARIVALRPVMMMLAYRPPEATPEQHLSGIDRSRIAALNELNALDTHHSINLEPLSNIAVMELVSAELDSQPVESELLAWLIERGHGNPLFIEETIKMLREQKTVAFIAERQQWEFAADQVLHAIPPTLKGVIQTRLDRLEPGTQLTCKVASVVGRVFAARVVAGIYPFPNEVKSLNNWLETLAQLDITPLESQTPELRYQFKSALMQEVAYTSLLMTQRQALHQAVAEWYEREYGDDLDTFVPLLADHYSHTEQWGRFLDFAERAGQAAARRYANDEALNYLTQAINVLRDKVTSLSEQGYQQRLFQLLLKRAEVYAHTNNYALQELDLKAVSGIAKETRDLHGQALVYISWARYHQACNDYDASKKAALDALMIAQQLSDWQLSGESMNLLAKIADLRADYRQALSWALQAYMDCRLAENHRGEASALDFLGIAHTQLGEYSRANKYYQQALYLRRAIGDRWGEADSLGLLGDLAEKLGRPRDALRSHEEALSIRRMVGDRIGEANSLNSIGNAYQALGDLGLAQRYLHEALTIWQMVGDRYGEAVVLTSLSGIASALSDFEAAANYAERSLSLARKLGNRHVEADALDLLGNASRGLNNYDAAYEHHQGAYSLAHDLELRRREAYTLHHLGEWEWHMGNYAAAAQYWNDAADLRATMGELVFANASRTRQAHALAVLGNLAEARTTAEQVWAEWGINPPPGEDEEELREGYFSLHETWRILGDNQRATAALAWGYQAVQDRAVRISDTGLRQSFLNRVIINYTIIEAWRVAFGETFDRAG
ncbi:MAG: tetratricopeptide repeat protein [Chloroflexaceae bacterium]|nr:tetratricopeptide repeat protein [Chloroflexaceae bacterium]